MEKLVSLFSLAHHARRFAADETGATAIEYAMIASGIALAIAATLTAVGGSVKGMFVSIANIFS